MLATSPILRACLFFSALLTAVWQSASAAAPPAAKPKTDPAALFARDRLIAWCIVPFDAKKRGPEERAAMLESLGLKHFAYDWRAEHIPTFDAELAALKRHGIALDAFWFPGALDAHAKVILDLLARHQLKPQLWVTGGGAPTHSPDEQRARVAAEAARLRPIAEAAGRIGCTVGLYNHGGWFGEPENQLAILAELKLPNVGLVYNLHHGHAHVDRFAELLAKMQPHLLCVNLNGMDRDAEQHGNKIMPLGQGKLDLELLKTLVASGYPGPIGILGHTMDDAQQRLLDNLDGLDWLVKQLQGQPAGPRPQPRTWRRAPAGKTASAGKPNQWMIEGRSEYRQPPLTVACTVQLEPRATYNIIAACDTKNSGTHWELFTMPGSGYLTAYLPGMRPDHVHSKVNVCDRKPHHVGLMLEAQRARLLVDGKVVAEQAMETTNRASKPGPLAVGRLVEGTIDCAGEVRSLHLLRGVAEGTSRHGAGSAQPGPATLGLWNFTEAKSERVADASPLHNLARRATGVETSPMPPPGMHLASTDARLRMQLIDRSPDQAYMALKADGAGRLFVGGREAVFVFEPDGHGGFRPRQTLLRFGEDSIIIGLELRGDDLYVMTGGALYVVPEGRTRRTGLKPRRILWGLPLDLHVSFHCLAWGPQGDLYLDHGDPLLSYVNWQRPGNWGHWTLFAGRENRPLVYNGAGGVLRMRPDGDRLQAIAGGLRGPVGLAFDDRWDLFTNDNDHESRPDQFAPCRLLHVVPHVDFGWPRGWMASKNPDRADLIEPMTADLGRGVPCDLLYFDEPSWPAEYRRRLLMCRWGSAIVGSYPLVPRGASFSTNEQVFLSGSENARPVGITVDPQGRMFVSSLYMAGNAASPHCASDVVMIVPGEPGALPTGVPQPPGKDTSELTDAELWQQLAAGSWERRRRAHHEILRRGGGLLDEAARRFCAADETAPEFLNLAWLAGRSGRQYVAARLSRMAASADAGQRAQALRIFTEYPALQPSRALMESRLSDADAAVRLAALEFFFTDRPGDSVQPLPLEPVARLAADADTYLRQIAARLLSQRATDAELRDLSQGPEAASRLAAVLAAGMRLTTPPAGERPPAAIKLFYPQDNAFFRSQLKYADVGEPIDLREFGPIGGFMTSERWKLLGPAADQAMFKLLDAALADKDDRVALEAVHYLHLLDDPRSEPQLASTVERVWRDRLRPHPAIAVKQIWLLGPLAADAAAAVKLNENTIDLAAAYATPDGSQHWRKVPAGAGNGIPIVAAHGSGPWHVYGTFTLQSQKRQKAILGLSWPGFAEMRLGGRPIAWDKSGEGSRQALIDLQAGSNDVVMDLSGDRSSPASLAITCTAAGGISAELPEQITGALLAERLREAAAGGKGGAIPRELAEADWPAELRRADVGHGRQLFATLGCAKCHAISPEQAGGGAPSLAEARRRFNLAHLVESILLPSKQVAEPFRASTLVMDDGRVLSGLIVAESADSIELLLADGSRRTLRPGDIEDRSRSDQSPMPQGIVKSVAELRDLLGYLTSDRPRPP
jgi:putative heme-binding domain-containing protein